MPKAWTVLTAAITGFIGAAAAVDVAISQNDKLTMVVVAFFMGSVSLMLFAGLHVPSFWASTTLDDSPAWRLRLGPPRLVSFAVSAVLAVTAFALGWGSLTVADRSILVGLVVGLCAMSFLLLSAHLGLTAYRRPALIIGVDKLRYEGGRIVELAWTDVGVIEWAHCNTRRSCLRIGAVVEPASYTVQRRWSVFPLELKPREPGIEIRVGLLNDFATLKILRDLHRASRPDRAVLMARGLPPSRTSTRA